MGQRQRPVVTVIAAAFAAALVEMLTGAGAVPARAGAVPPVSITMVQGTVVAVHRTSVDIETAPIYPSCTPHGVCPMFVVAGQRIDVRITPGATVDASDGLPVSRQAIALGVWLAAAGRFAPPAGSIPSVRRTFDAVAVDVARTGGTPFPCALSAHAMCPLAPAR